MITQMTISTQDEYNKIFVDMTNFLNKQGEYANAIIDNNLWPKENISNNVQIKTLADYYYQLPNVVTNIGKIQDVEKFLKLPLQEPLFVIDANSRVIQIPTEFKQNGIGSLGDNGAEILYFSINRYFDAIDFGSDKIQIYIQWENAAGEEGISTAFYKDIISNANFIYFGWEITDKITKQAGAVRFSIRILAVDDKQKVNYEFNTLTATVGVNATLHYDFDYASVESSSAVAERVKNRIVASPGLTSVELAVPVFYEPNKNYTLDLEKQPSGEYSVDLTAFASNANLTTTISDGVDYFWYHKIENENSLTEDSWSSLTQGTIYVETIDTSIITRPTQGVIYYASYDEETKTLSDSITYEDTWPTDSITGETLYKKLYVKKGKITVDQAHEYYVKAKAVSGKLNSNYSICDFHWTIPKANPLSIDAENITKNNASKIILNYNEDTKAYEATLTSNVNNLTDYHYITYTILQDDEQLNDGEIKEQMNLNQQLSFTDENKIAGQGRYEIRIVGTKNNNKTNPKSQYINITLPAPQPINAVVASDVTKMVQLSSNNSKATASCSYVTKWHERDNGIQALFSETYDWYGIPNTVVNNDSGDFNNIVLNAYNGTLTNSNNAELLEKCEKISTIPSQEPHICDIATSGYNYIFCIITANFNGDTKSTSTPIFQNVNV